MKITSIQKNRNELAKLFKGIGAEIGVERGVFSQVIMTSGNVHKLYAVDCWQAYRGYRDHVGQQKLDSFYESTKKRMEPYNCWLVRKFSLDAAKDFEDESLDFVYIDANHDYENAYKDIEAWSKKVTKGGIVAGHDYIRRKNQDKFFSIVQAVNDFGEKYKIPEVFIYRGDKSPSWMYYKSSDQQVVNSKIKVFANNIIEDRAIDRISNALKTFAPKNIEFVNTKDEAEIIIHFINGRRDGFRREIEAQIANGKKVAIVQLSVRSTKNKSTTDWIELWKKANVVWSYYDIKKLCKEDGIKPDFNFYYAPLGINGVFKKHNLAKKYIIAISSKSYTTESARECIIAAEHYKKRIFNVGPKISQRPSIDCAAGISDEELSKKYSQCEYVSGLRRKEGFELPIIEGAVCGARPIVFDKPHYKKWFKDFSIFIPENSREKTILSLKNVFSKKPKPLADREIGKIKSTFSWEKIIDGFWKKMI